MKKPQLTGANALSQHELQLILDALILRENLLCADLRHARNTEQDLLVKIVSARISETIDLICKINEIASKSGIRLQCNYMRITRL